MIKLYDEDSYIKEFTATVVSCKDYKNGYLITLDKTAFFPTAGGQSCDTGTIDGKRVSDVFISDNEIFHFVTEKIKTGKTVDCVLDWNERFRKMQHHSGEHIVSGIAFSKFGAKNVGFHLNEKEVTIDYDIELSKSRLNELERSANEAVQKNIEISARYPDDEELRELNYRSKLELTENIRIVTIPGIDVCACCAPHVKRTGEIGVIKLTDAIRHRGGMRIHMICGMDALLDYEEKKESVAEISGLLSVKQSEVKDGVKTLMQENDCLKQTVYELKKQIMKNIADNIPKTEGNLTVFLKSADKASMRILANTAKNKVDGIFAVLSQNEKGGYNYILTSEVVKLQNYSKSINDALSGRGGGKEDIEGTFFKSQKEIEEYFKNTKF